MYRQSFITQKTRECSRSYTAPGCALSWCCVNK
uniref:Uncharacterized protein n=1 Tax=Myoviridae sp. ct0Tg8 TaxID=2826598 RepID=A0A8S5NBQ8_9CAUD|nr:MAG TPA: hypothetical protein [Myoviridae sp. ct0Tg8]DAP36114.1 MAG TPA: hypothetical protein [Caudoviricetes sp.]DAQ45094.1 MAG TPA: hypothetical protein [Caudoviricetes sp.]